MGRKDKSRTQGLNGFRRFFKFAIFSQMFDDE